MKAKKCKKVLLVLGLILLISAYLAVNATYMRFVYLFEDYFANDKTVLDNKLFCYPFAMTYIKESISRNESTTYDPLYAKLTDHLYECYSVETRYVELLHGNQQLLGQSFLSSEYRYIEESLNTNTLC